MCNVFMNWCSFYVFTLSSFETKAVTKNMLYVNERLLFGLIS